MKLWIPVAFVASSLALTSGANAQSLTCPDTIESDLTSGGQPQSFKFRYVSFFDGDPAEMADLAPDDGPNQKILEQRWQFTRAPDRPIYMVCRYHGTEQTFKAQVPGDVKQCRLSGLIDDRGEIIGSPALECE